MVTPPAGAALAGTRAAGRGRATLRPPRRLSGPARRPNAAPAPRRALAHAGSPLLQLLAAAERLARHPLLDRLIRSRAWLVLIASALIGVVTLQLAVLKLNGGVARTLQTEALLRRENAALSIENSELAAADRVQTRAAQMGMEFAPSTALRSLAATPRVDLGRAAGVLGAPVRSQQPGGEEGGGAAQSQAGGEGSSAQSGEAAAEGSPAGAAEGSPAGEGGSEPASSSRSGASTGGAETSAAASQGGSHESEAASPPAGGGGASEPGSGG